ncbi:hypothetical protein CEF21_02790 [Bacillus sp. FJAT-42376]|nr:hypothetical protein CEF21_02790 [Bacillus sp. FJAT-42376]
MNSLLFRYISLLVCLFLYIYLQQKNLVMKENFPFFINIGVYFTIFLTYTYLEKKPRIHVTIRKIGLTLLIIYSVVIVILSWMFKVLLAVKIIFSISFLIVAIYFIIRLNRMTKESR